MLPELNADNALIFRISHIQNVPWILENGLHCKNSGRVDPQFVTIGDPDLIAKRAARPVPTPPRGTLSDYIPFYFTPLSPMMYNIVTGWGDIPRRRKPDIVIMVSSLRSLADSGIDAVYTDRHAYLKTARFLSSLDDLSKIDWPRACRIGTSSAILTIQKRQTDTKLKLSFTVTCQWKVCQASYATVKMSKDFLSKGGMNLG